MGRRGERVAQAGEGGLGVEQPAEVLVALPGLLRGEQRLLENPLALAVLLALHDDGRNGGLAALAVIAATLGANLAPTLIYQAQHGSNPRLERSAAADQRSDEALSLRPANLVAPAADDRIGPLARLGASYDKSIAPGYCEACHAGLGVVGSAGLLWLIACGLGTLASAAAGARYFAV